MLLLFIDNFSNFVFFFQPLAETRLRVSISGVVFCFVHRVFHRGSAPTSKTCVINV